MQDAGAKVDVVRESGVVELNAEALHTDQDLEAVNLRIRRDTWQVEGMRLTFDDSVFDLTEVDFAVLRKYELPGEILAALDEPEPARINSAAPTTRAKLPLMKSPAVDEPARNLAEIELETEYQLHRIGADLSEPIEVVKNEREITIKASGATGERKQQIRALFLGVPAVRLELESAPIAATGPVTSVADAAASQAPERDRRIPAFFGSAEAQENFARAVLSSEASILARLYALRNLAEHWPPANENGLPEGAREKLQGIVEDHVAALRLAVPELRRDLAPFLEQFCGGEASSSPPAPLPWRDFSAQNLTAARAADTALRALLTTSDRSTTIERACPAIQTSLDALANLRVLVER
jgi:hypothetical protein